MGEEGRGEGTRGGSKNKLMHQMKIYIPVQLINIEMKTIFFSIEQ